MTPTLVVCLPFVNDFCCIIHIHCHLIISIQSKKSFLSSDNGSPYIIGTPYPLLISFSFIKQFTLLPVLIFMSHSIPQENENLVSAPTITILSKFKSLTKTQSTLYSSHFTTSRSRNLCLIKSLGPRWYCTTPALFRSKLQLIGMSLPTILSQVPPLHPLVGWDKDRVVPTTYRQSRNGEGGRVRVLQVHLLCPS